MEVQPTKKQVFESKVSSKLNKYRIFLKRILCDAYSLPHSEEECKDEDKKTYNQICNILNNTNNEKVFLNAITHESFCPADGENYELLENRGDLITGHVFVEYLYERFPAMKQSQASNLKHRYMRASYQTQVGVKLKLDRFILYQFSPNMDPILEDAFESMFGAIYVACLQTYPSLTGRGIGHQMCYALMVHIIDIVMKEKIDIYDSLNYEMIVKETFELMGVKGDAVQKPVVDYTSNRKRYSSRVVIPHHMIEKVSLIRHLLSEDGVLCTVSSFDESSVHFKAAKQAYEILEKNNLGPRVIKQHYNKMMLGETLFAKFMEKLKEDGFIDYTFKTPKGTKKYLENVTVEFIALMGILEGGEDFPILTIDSHTEKGQAKKSKKILVEAYVEGPSRKLNYGRLNFGYQNKERNVPKKA